MSKCKNTSLSKSVSEADVDRLSAEADDRIKAEKNQHKCITWGYIKLAFANRIIQDTDSK
jgi:hypothetical protein